MREAVIVAYGRSAVGRAYKGSLKDASPVKVGAQVLTGVLNKIPQLPLDQIDDVIVGCAFPEGIQGLNLARNIVLAANLPDCIPAQTINRFCSSGLQTIALAANAINSGEGDIIVAGGVELMSSVPMYGSHPVFDKDMIELRPEVHINMGLTTEKIVEKYNVSRVKQDQFAVSSHKKSAQASENGFFDNEIIPIDVDIYATNKETFVTTKETVTFKKDECFRAGTNAEKLSELKPVFKRKGTVTAGNSSQISDGVGFVVVMSADKAKELRIKPIARYIGYQAVGLAPELMGMGPVVAIPKVLNKANLSIDQMDLIELNEAFAGQSLACINELNLDMNKVNVNGGAISLGHPLGATGTILTVKLLNELERQKLRFGMVSMCIGGGMGAAGIFELVN